MSYSIVGSGRGQLKSALDSYGYASQIEQERENTNDQIEAANDQQNSQAAGVIGGAALKYAIGQTGTTAATGAATATAGTAATTGTGVATTGGAAAGTETASTATSGGPWAWLSLAIAGKATHDISSDYYSGQDALTGRALVKNFDRKYEEQGNEFIDGFGSGGKLAVSLASWDFGSAKEATEDGQHSIGYQFLKKVF